MPIYVTIDEWPLRVSEARLLEILQARARVETRRRVWRNATAMHSVWAEKACRLYNEADAAATPRIRDLA